jgi:hypothetical protein
MTDNQSEVACSHVAAVKKQGEARDQFVQELRKSIVGMDSVVDDVLKWNKL